MSTFNKHELLKEISIGVAAPTDRIGLQFNIDMDKNDEIFVPKNKLLINYKS